MCCNIWGAWSWIRGSREGDKTRPHGTTQQAGSGPPARHGHVLGALPDQDVAVAVLRNELRAGAAPAPVWQRKTKTVAKGGGVGAALEAGLLTMCWAMQ